MVGLKRIHTLYRVAKGFSQQQSIQDNNVNFQVLYAIPLLENSRRETSKECDIE